MTRKQQYHAELQTADWRRRRWEYLTAHPNCENCGRNTGLQVHHPKYIAGRKAWEYSDAELVALCDRCHLSIHAEQLSGSSWADCVGTLVKQIATNKSVKPVTKGDVEIMRGAIERKKELAKA